VLGFGFRRYRLLGKNEDKTPEDSSTQEEEAYKEVTYSSQLSDVLKVNMALKTLQVIGQILRNSPGSMRGNVKFDITKESYGLGLRVLRVVLALAETNMELLREYFSRFIGE